MSLHVQFTRGGRDTGTIPDGLRPEDANDVHFTFKRGTYAPKLRYRAHGKDIDGGEHTAPPEAHDVSIEFRGGKFGDSHWTDAKGKAIGGPDGYIAPPPEGANEWHLDVSEGEITEAEWSKNGEMYLPRQPIDVPKNVNDVHLSFSQPRDQKQLTLGNERAALAGLIGYVLGASIHSLQGYELKQMLDGMGLALGQKKEGTKT